MLDGSLFANPRFSAASGAVAISFFALQGFIFVITQYLQLVKFYSPFSMGVRLLPMAFAVALSSIVGTKLAVWIGNKVIVVLGLVLFAGGLLWTSANTGVGAAVNDATRLFGGTLGVAVIGSVASSLYRSRLESALPADPVGHEAYSAASRSFGAALQVSHTLAVRGLGETAESNGDGVAHSSIGKADGRHRLDEEP